MVDDSNEEAGPSGEGQTTGTGFGASVVDPNPDDHGGEKTDENSSKKDGLNGDSDQKADIEKLRADYESMKAENVKLAERTAKSETDAQQAQGYVRQIVERMQQAAQQQPPPDPNQLRESMEADPNSVLDAHFNARIAPLAKMTLEAHSNTNFQVFESQMRENEDWKTYRGEVEKFMESIPLEVKAQPNSWPKAFDFVRANHLDEIIERRAAKSTKMERAAFVEGPSGPGPQRSKKVELNETQKQIAKGLGVSEDEYREWMR